MSSRIRLITASWMPFEIKASEDGHVNSLKFKGVLLITDEPSTKPPNGSQGHKIMIPTSVAAANLHTLKNMGVDYTNDFDKHDPKKKVGVIKKAWLDGNKLMVSGIIWKKDFPDIEKVLDAGRLGMSFEGSEISVEDSKAAVWKITNVCFTGAAILYKTAAAYVKTEALAASASMYAELVKTEDGGHSMSKKVDKSKEKSRRVHASGKGSSGHNQENLVTALQTALSAALAPVTKLLKTNTAAIATLAASMEEMQDNAVINADGASGMVGKGKKKVKADKTSSSTSSATSSSSVSSEEASAASSEESSGSSAGSASASSDEIHADADKGGLTHKDGSSSSSSASSEEASANSDASDGDDLEDMGDGSDAMDHDDDEKPGTVHKGGIKNKGNKTHVSTKKDKHKTSPAGVHASAGSKKLRKYAQGLAEENKELKASIQKFSKQTKKMQKQLSAAADGQTRRSMPHVSARLEGLFTKNGVDISTISATGEKLTHEEFNSYLDKFQHLSVSDRIAMKAEAAHSGFID